MHLLFLNFFELLWYDLLIKWKNTKAYGDTLTFFHNFKVNMDGRDNMDSTSALSFIQAQLTLNSFHRAIDNEKSLSLSYEGGGRKLHNLLFKSCQFLLLLTYYVTVPLRTVFFSKTLNRTYFFISLCLKSLNYKSYLF